MRGRIKLLFFVFLIFFLIFGFKDETIRNIFAEPNCSNISSLGPGDYDFCITQINNIVSQLAPAQQKNKEQLASLKTQIAGLQNEIDGISGKLDDLSAQIQKREADLSYTRIIFNEKTVEQYKFLRSYDPVLPFFSSDSATSAVLELTLRERVADGDRASIEDLASQISNLNSDKDTLSKDKANLAIAQSNINKQATFLAGEVAKVESYLSELSNEQQQLISLKSGNFSVSVGDAALADDFNASFAGWQQNAPSSSVTVFSFGAYAGNGSNYQRNGMSQYGAWARAKNGQDVNAILQAYYGQAPINRDMPATINTNQGSMPFETQYLYGIAEMPSSWTDNNNAALKAQAIAARTYAYHYTQGGATICTDDHCQVYSASKAANPPQAWKDAVDATKGMILPDGVAAQYVSTPGGYLDTKGWDTTCGNQGCVGSSAWDAASPWFYKAWYTNYKYGSGFSTCDRNNPWLTQSDFVDILNAWVVYTNGSSDDANHILPVDGCGGGNPYNQSDMANKAASLGGAYSSVANVAVGQNQGGYTASITFQTDRGALTITGFDTGCSHSGSGCKDFWTIFNLRAPGNISIKARMFDIRIK